VTQKRDGRRGLHTIFSRKAIVFIQPNGFIVVICGVSYLLNQMVELKRKVRPVRSAQRNLDSVFSALADPSRRKMVGLLRNKPLSISDISRPFRMSFAGVAKHVDVLEGAGIVRKVRDPQDGRVFIIQLQREPLDEAVDWLEYHREFWSGKLDSLEAFMEEQDGNADRKNRKKN
jgi:DNA-binding transcriptional ArsR family regulator